MAKKVNPKDDMMAGAFAGAAVRKFFQRILLNVDNPSFSR
jgi:hypothetical protein